MAKLRFRPGHFGTMFQWFQRNWRDFPKSRTFEHPKDNNLWYVGLSSLMVLGWRNDPTHGQPNVSMPLSERWPLTLSKCLCFQCFLLQFCDHTHTISSINKNNSKINWERIVYTQKGPVDDSAKYGYTYFARGVMFEDKSLESSMVWTGVQSNHSLAHRGPPGARTSPRHWSADQIGT